MYSSQTEASDNFGIKSTKEPCLKVQWKKNTNQTGFCYSENFGLSCGSWAVTAEQSWVHEKYILYMALYLSFSCLNLLHR